MAVASPLTSDGNLLTGSVVSGPASARINIDGRDYINFAGSGYLALGRQPELRDAAIRAVTAGAAFSQQLPVAYGALDSAIRDLEATAAVYCGTDAAVYFASGYLIGGAILGNLDISRSALFVDEGAHSSLVDAARLTSRPLSFFSHCDPDSLLSALKMDLQSRMRPIVVTDGVFASTGRLAPLDRYADIIESYDGRLVVDEAHGFGAIGPNGRGAADFLGVESLTTAAATLSKALCSQGAVIGCDRPTAGKLAQSPPLRGANAGSPISAAVGTAAIRYMIEHPERRTRLSELTTYLRRGLRSMGIDTGNSPAPIVAFRVGDRACMRSLQRRLFESGIFVLHSNYTGAGSEGLIRCSVFADHAESDLDALLSGLQ